MKITAVEMRLLQMRLLRPFRTSFGVQQDRYPLLLRMDVDGISAWSECVAGEGPWYSAETVDTAWEILRTFLIPAVRGRDLSGVDELERLMAPVRGHRMAKAALEMGFSAALAESTEQPLAAWLGGSRTTVETGVSIGIQANVDALLALIDEHLRQGYRRIKVKIEPGWDVDVIATVRSRYPEISLMADANSAYELEDAPRLRELDRYGLLMLEQPLTAGDLLDHAALQAQLSTPICLDESIESAQAARQAIRIRACLVVNIKPGRVGGFAESRRIHDLAREAGVPVWCGGMLETGIGRAANVALASLPNFTLPGDLSASDRYWAEDIVEPPFRLIPGSQVTVPHRAGLGVDVKSDMVDRLTVRRELIQ